MLIKKIIYLLFLGFVFSSCNNDIGEEKILIPEESLYQEHSEESKVIESLDNFINNLKGTPSTKSIISEKAKVIDMKRVPVSTYSGELTTKSTNKGLEVYELKLKNTDNSEGFAVITDTETNEVIAYAPVGSIEDTTYNKSLAFYFRTLALSSKSLNTTLQTKVIDPDFAQGGLGDMLYYTIGTQEYYRDLTKEEITKYGSSWVFYSPVHLTRFVPAYLLTQWNQSAPYNNKVEHYYNGKRYPVGCVSVAIGQILSRHRKPDQYNWNALNYSPVVSSSSSPVIIEEVSKLLWDLALITNSKFINGKTTASDRSIIPAFEKMGYTAKGIYYGSEPTIKFVADEIMNHHRPVLHIGTHDDGHAWVVDEVLMRECWKYFSRYVNGKYLLYRIKVQGYSLHCNWGWGGNSDGYYYNFVPTRGNIEYLQDMAVFYEIKPIN